MDFFKKIEEADENLFWNIPEQKQGFINIVGGNLQNFRTPVKTAEFLNAKFPIQTINLILPDALKDKLPPLPNLVFTKSTESGSFADASEILASLDASDFNLVVGDLSKNSITEKVISEICKKTSKPILITRDSVDLLSNVATESVLMNENLIIMASMAQLQKLLKAIYYPRMLLLTSPLSSAAETLHKFTLSYPVSIISLHNGQILVAKNGNVTATSLEKTTFSPISFWDGELAAKIVALNLYNPNNFIPATTSAIISSQY